MSPVMTPSAAWAFATTAEITASAPLQTVRERDAAHLACRRAVRSVFGCRARLSLVSRPGRSPSAFVEDRASTHQLKVSLSHRDGVGAAIVSRNGDAVGIDIERVNAVQPDHGRFFLTRRERRAATDSPTTVWSLKEAAWKALELDASVAFHELELEFDRANLVAVLFRGTRRPTTATVSNLKAGFVVAVVQIRSAS